jgi:hypothetical protein
VGDDPALGKCLLLVGARASSPTSIPFAARPRQQTSRMLQRAPNEVKSPVNGRLTRPSWGHPHSPTDLSAKQYVSFWVDGIYAKW